MGACELKVYDKPITGVQVLDCDDEHKENESGKEPEEAKAASFQEVLHGKQGSLWEKPNSKR